MGLFTKYQGLEKAGGITQKSLKFNDDSSFNAQPFIQTPIPGDGTKPYILSPSFASLVQKTSRSATDVVRLSKFMTTPAGIEFIAKQELLSLNAVQTEISGKLNGGIYNPLTTLAQAGVNFAGANFPSLQDKLSVDVKKPRLGYGPTVYGLDQSDPNIYNDNRLVDLHFINIENNFGDSGILLRYPGGPGSILGRGSTDIKFATYPDEITPLRTMGVSFIFPEGELNTPGTYQAIYDHPDKTIYEIDNPRIESIETKYGLGNPGRKKFNQSTGTYDLLSTTSSLDTVNGQVIYSSKVSGAIKDAIEIATNDLVTFKIGILDSDGKKTNYMHFRSFIDSFSDSYSSDWSSQAYMGRGEKLYKYNSFDRSINISFTVAAQSRGEMAGIYQKLNHLASSVTPQYTDYGYMTGNIAKLTVGNYVNEQHGKIDSISYEIPEESPWLIDGEEKYKKQQLHDLSTVVNELPFIIKVQMKFTPIHNFRPELTTNVLDGKFGDQRYITIPIKPKTKGKLTNEPDTPSEMTVNGKPLPKPQGTLKPLFTTKPPIVISNPNNPTNLGENTSAITNNGMVPGLKPDNSVLNPFSTQFNKSEKPQSVVINKSMMSIDNNSNDFFSPAKSSGRKKKSSSWKNLFRFNRNASTYST